jgi:hypothetical protein
MSTAKTIRKTHRYLGLFTGIQFLLWTISGLYFSWTDINDIHGDLYKITKKERAFEQLIGLSELQFKDKITSVELRDIIGTPYYWINNKQLVNAYTGILKKGITATEAVSIAKEHIIKSLKVKDVVLLETVEKHHEYREKKIPVYVISYKGNDAIKAYVSKEDGKFQTIRHSKWRIFDFLWMTHTMDYEGRDNINTLTLRIFSLVGCFTVISGFVLYFNSSKTLRRLKKRIYKNQ